MDIYEALKSGQTIEEIAAAFAADLNEAEQRVKAEEAAKRAEEEAALQAKQEQEAKEAAKVEDITSACAHFWTVLQKHYPDLLDSEDYNIEEMEELAKSLIGLLDLYAKPFAHMKNKPVAKNNDDAVIADFFKMFGL